MNQSGLTLAEILVVMAIMAAGWFALLPSLDPSGPDQDFTTRVNSLLLKAQKQALESGQSQRITFPSSKDALQWEKSRESLPAGLSSLKLNSSTVHSRPASFRIYPTGHMDELQFMLLNGERFFSRPLSAEIFRKK